MGNRQTALAKPYRPLRGVTRRHAIEALFGAIMIAPIPARGGPVDRSITRGVNIPLWLDGPDGASNRPSAEVLSFLRNLGFETIRLPTDPDRFVAAHSIVKAALQELSLVLSELTDLGFTVTIDMHPMGAIGEALASDVAAEHELVRAWEQISAVAASTSPKSVFLELLNEPPLWQNRWLPLRERLATLVRRACPHHTIIWGAGRFQTISETLACPPLRDPNSIVAVHYYAPLGFTHQCQSWGTSVRSEIGALPFPADFTSPNVRALLPSLTKDAADYLLAELEGGWSVSNIDADFDRLAEWARGAGVQVIVNEFASSGACTDAGSRVRWTRAVRAAAERHHIGWTYWEFDRGFGFMEGRSRPIKIERGIIDALLGATR